MAEQWFILLSDLAIQGFGTFSIIDGSSVIS